ncbi:MAG: sulfotransferase family protein [Rhizobiaceae bacterium]|nr:MAG: sulfotransferase family protein [Rhizobiaceae bacterium]
MTLKVIGAGFGRTGTMSMKHALQMLGLGQCYHMEEVMVNGHFERWETAAQSDAPDWAAIFEGFGATVDWPGATFWRSLVEHYPDAKVILSVRDSADAWFESTQKTIFSPQLMALLPPQFSKMMWLTIHSLFDGAIHDRDCCVEVYERHNAAVIAAVPAERLLVYRPGDGWEPLCAFLGCPVPEVPYPRLNDSAAFLEGLGKMAQSS